MGGGLESRCVGRVNGADESHGTIRTVHMMCPEMQVLYFYMLTEAETARGLRFVCLTET